MIRAVIDTNVLVSGMISPAGNEALLILAINQGLVTPCLSSEILEEYSEVLQRPKFGFSVGDVSALLDSMSKRGELLEGFSVVPVSPDPGDDKFIACAAAARSEFLVTGNKRHFPVPLLHDTRLVSAAELVEFITAGI